MRKNHFAAGALALVARAALENDTPDRQGITEKRVSDVITYP